MRIDGHRRFCTVAKRPFAPSFLQAWLPTGECEIFVKIEVSVLAGAVMLIYVRNKFRAQNRSAPKADTVQWAALCSHWEDGALHSEWVRFV